MKPAITKSIIFSAIAVMSLNSLADTGQIPSISGDFGLTTFSQPKASSRDMKMIYQPSLALLDREKNGFVYIYDGFTDVEVKDVMDKKFERIQNMMFTRVKITDDKGLVLKDPETGTEMVENDGCD